MMERIKKVVATYYGYNFNEYGACLNMTQALTIRLDGENYIKVFTYRQKDGEYRAKLDYRLGMESGWGGGLTWWPSDVFKTEQAAIEGVLNRFKQWISKPYTQYEHYKKLWQRSILIKLNNEIRKLTQPKQMSIFDYTSETLNLHNHETIRINTCKDISQRTSKSR